MDHQAFETARRRVMDDMVTATAAAMGVYTKPCTACACFGSVLKARVALAAYCGSEAAREAGRGFLTLEALGPAVLPGGGQFQPWLSGLSRWQAHPFSASVRAALAAAEAVYVRWCRVPQYTQQVTNRREQEVAVRRALDAVAAWLDDPSAKNREACSIDGPYAPEIGPPFNFLLSFVAVWEGGPARSVGDWPHMWFGYQGTGRRPECPISFAEHHPSGEPAIREAIQSALIRWALAG